MSASEILVSLDIGTTKICATIGKKNDFGKIEIIGFGKSESLGVMRGVVANIDKTVASIKAAVGEAERKAGIDIKDIYVGIAGQHINSIQHRGILMRDKMKEEICREDIDKLIEDMYKINLPPGDKTIHVLPQEFIVDNEMGIKDPVGMQGVRLEANFHIITGQITAAQNIYKCVEKAGLHVIDLVLEPLASSAAVLGADEREAGVALVDIGGGTTDIAIFQDDIIRHTAAIPFGGNVITEDIREGFRLMRNHAEDLKIKYGSALSNEAKANTIVAIPGLRNQSVKEVSVKTLAAIIQARVEEIFEQVHYEIRTSGFERKLIAGIVLTGGGAQLEHLVQLVEYNTGLNARVGYPTEHLAKGISEELTSPMYATGIGLILNGLGEIVTDTKQSADINIKRNPVGEKWWESLFRKSKNFLDDADETALE